MCKVEEEEAQRRCCSRFDQASQAVSRRWADLHEWLYSASQASRRVVMVVLWKIAGLRTRDGFVVVFHPMEDVALQTIVSGLMKVER